MSLGNLFSGSQGQTQNTSTNSTSTTDYPSWFNADTSTIANQAMNLSDYKNNPYPTFNPSSIFAPFDAAQNQSFGQVNDLQGAYQPFYNNATNAVGGGYGASSGYFNNAGAQPTALQAGSPFASAAATTWNQPGVAQSYMNPYMNSALAGSNALSSQNFTQNVLPSLTNSFVASGGGLGSSAYDNAMNWATNNFNQNLNTTNNQAMANAYGTAGQQFNSDASRLASLSGTVGNQAASTMSGLTGLGTAASNAGNNTGSIFGNLGTGYLNAGLTGSNALLQAGNQQQQQAQNPLTFGYQQALNQFQYPFQATSFGANTLGSLRVPTTQNTQSNSTSTMGGQSAGSPIGSILGLGSSIMSMFPGLGDGISNLFSGSGGGMSAAGTSGSPYFGPVNPYQARGGHIDFNRGGYLGLEHPSNFTRDETKQYARGGYLGLEHPSNFTRDETKQYARGGPYFAKGGAAHDILGDVGSLANFIFPGLGIIGKFAGNALGDVFEGDTGNIGTDAERDFTLGIADPDAPGGFNPNAILGAGASGASMASNFFNRGGYFAKGGGAGKDDLDLLGVDFMPEAPSAPPIPPPHLSTPAPAPSSGGGGGGIGSMLSALAPLAGMFMANRGGYLGLEHPSNFTRDETKLYRRGGHFTSTAAPKATAFNNKSFGSMLEPQRFSAGGYAAAVKAGRRTARNDEREVAIAEHKKQQGVTRDLPQFASGGYFAGDGFRGEHTSMPHPSAFILMPSSPGYFRHG